MLGGAGVWAPSSSRGERGLGAGGRAWVFACLRARRHYARWQRIREYAIMDALNAWEPGPNRTPRGESSQT
jgi:hypothetical protein